MIIFFRKKAVFALTLSMQAFALFAADAGLTLDQTMIYETTDQEDQLTYEGTLAPWFSMPLGEDGKLYISAGITAEYFNEQWSLVPELLQAEITWHFGKDREIKIGRTGYSDPLGFIISGFFDGARYVQDDILGGTLGAGAWYSGLLYKRRAHITMTEADLAQYNEHPDYGKFWDTYFAPRRLLIALDWEHPGLMEWVRLKLGLISQFDLSGNEKLYHSQYLLGKVTVPVNAFVFELGGCIGLAEASRRFQVSFAGELGIGWMPPTSIQDRLMLTGRFSSGMVNNNVTAFVPITTETQGYILKAKLTGLSMIQIDYTARLFQSLSVSLFSSYFILSDMGTYQGLPSGRDGYFLGNEFYAQAVWSPFSDLQIKAGGGIFLPSLGNADKKGAVLWQLDINMIIAFF